MNKNSKFPIKSKYNGQIVRTFRGPHRHSRPMPQRQKNARHAGPANAVLPDRLHSNRPPVKPRGTSGRLHITSSPSNSPGLLDGELYSDVRRNSLRNLN